MAYLLTGIGAALLVLWGLQRFKTANVSVLARRLVPAGGWLAVGLAVVLALRGMFSAAFVVGTLGSFLITGRRGLPWANWPGGSGGGPGGGRSSKVVTDHLEMVLDHESGAMRGRVLKGVFAGRPIERLAPAELALLWRDCRFADPKSAQLIEAWLDRTHPSWREDMARAEQEPGAGGIMTRLEALEILGLAEGASDEDIRRAHRELIKRMHPDAGGSSYLAAKINEAKDLLLKR